jgi:hypothetical protein
MKGSMDVTTRSKLRELGRREFLVMGAATFALSSAGWGQSESPGSESAPAEDVGLPQIPYPESKVIKGVRWLTNPIHDRDRQRGDCWASTWADDNNIYTVGDDTMLSDGYWNLSVYKVAGTPPKHIVTPINEMKAYGQSGRPYWWKASGLASIDGVLYLGIYSQSNPRKGPGTSVSFNADGSSIIKSTDHGKTWTPTATLDAPMFPAKEFPTPYFVQYGKDYSDAMDEYVYLVSNDGGWNNWNKMMLARVPRNRIGRLNRSDWEFFAGT